MYSITCNIFLDPYFNSVIANIVMCKDEPCYKEVNVYEKETNLLFQADEGIDHRISCIGIIHVFPKSSC